MTKDLGILQGELLVFGGVYSNLQALEALRAQAEAKAIPTSNIICTGDIVGYCAQPEECVQFIKDWGIHTIAGNVELNLRDEADDCGCNFNEGSRCDIFSRQWYPFAKKQLSADSIQWIMEIPEFITFEYNDQKVFVLHGSYGNTSEFIFKSTLWETKAQNFNATQADIILGGHCGLPFEDVSEGKYWLNAGVIGMPANDGQTDVWFMTMNDSNGLSYKHHTLSYDFAKANALMLANPLPTSYAQTLIDGIWDNCEILPAVETAAQGQAILV